MDTEHFAPLARLTPSLHDARPGSGFREVNAALRAEALRQLHLQQREWAGTLTTHSPGTSGLVGPAARAGLTDGLDVLRQAGGTARVQLADLLADITRVLPWFDSAPSALGEGVSSEHP
jgi:hypothetical protein